MYIYTSAGLQRPSKNMERVQAACFAERLLSLRFAMDPASARQCREGSAPQNLGSASFFHFGAGMAQLLEESWLVGLRDSSLFTAQVDLQAKRLEDLLKKAQPRTLCQMTAALNWESCDSSRGGRRSSCSGCSCRPSESLWSPSPTVLPGRAAAASSPTWRTCGWLQTRLC